MGRGEWGGCVCWWLVIVIEQCSAAFQLLTKIVNSRVTNLFISAVARGLLGFQVL